MRNVAVAPAMKKITVLFADEAVEFGGSLVVIGILANALDKKHYRTIIVGELDIALLRKSIKSDTHIYRIPRIYNYAHWSRTVKLINRLPAHLLRKSINYLLSALRSLVNAVYLIRLAVVILKDSVDVIHVNNGMNNLASVVCAVLLGRKFVVHIHGIENPGFIQKLLIKRVPEFITISDYLKNILIENGYPEERLVVIPNPVFPGVVSTEQTTELRKQYGINENEQVLGIVGRIIRWKGHVEFLMAAFLAMRAVPGLKVLIVGEFSDKRGLYRNEIIRMVEDSGYKERVIFTGYVSNVENYYSLMDVCIHASIEPEPFGLVITEAMACGVPVIASDRGAPGEIITDGENGYLVNPTETEKLSETIIRLLNDDALRGRIGARGKEHVLSNYQVGSYVQAMEKMYMKVLNETA